MHQPRLITQNNYAVFAAKKLTKIQSNGTTANIGHTNVVQTWKFWEKIHILHTEDAEVTLICGRSMLPLHLQHAKCGSSPRTFKFVP